MKNIKYTYIIVIGLLLSSCNSFLDVTPKGKVIPKSLTDFDELLNNPAHLSVVSNLTDMSSDNVEIQKMNSETAMLDSYGRAYYWYDYFYNPSEIDSFWENAYNLIYIVNVVLDNVATAKDGTESERHRIEAEARLLRAYHYWMLLNTYAKTYDASTASTDLGVPIILKPDLEAKVSRATVQEVVDIILKDLTFSPEWLPIKAKNRNRVSRSALYALQARIHLHIGKYEMAERYADTALTMNSKLLDYNAYRFKNPDKPTSSSIVNRPIDIESPEALMYRSSSFSSIIQSYHISADLEALYGDTTDLRLKFNFTNLNRIGEPTEDGKKLYMHPVNNTIGVPEMLLIKAECLARRGDIKALAILDTLRKNRIAKAAFKPLTNSKNLLKQVLDERERELAGNGMRWYDMKRLAHEGLYTKSITRSNSSYSRTLTPDSDYYVFPICSYVIDVNPLIIPNKR